MTVYLNSLERAWYSKKVAGTTAQTPIGQIKRTYWISQLGTTASNYGYDDLEARWLIKVIRDAGGTPGSDKGSTLWKEAVVALGVTPSKYVNQNKILFFQNAS